MTIFSIHPYVTVLVVVCLLAGIGITWFVFSAFWSSATYKPFLRVSDGTVAADSGARRTSERSSKSDGGNASARPTGTRAHDERRDDREIPNTGDDGFESRYADVPLAGRHYRDWVVDQPRDVEGVD